MPPRLLILRPQPGAAETAARARAFGLAAIIAPLFEVRPLAWEPPPPFLFDALLLTSANAPRHAGAALTSYAALPCYAVGERTAAAAREAGLDEVHIGPGDGQAALEMMAADGLRRPLHLSGRDHVGLQHPRLRIERRPVYAADAATSLPPEAVEALRGPTLVLLHSPRAGSLFANLAEAAGVDRSGISLAAISNAAAAAAGSGWRKVETADRPRDEALLELAAKLCKGGSGGE